jgi:hypothetical protein
MSLQPTGTEAFFSINNYQLCRLPNLQPNNLLTENVIN